MDGWVGVPTCAVEWMEDGCGGWLRVCVVTKDRREGREELLYVLLK